MISYCANTQDFSQMFVNTINIPTLFSSKLLNLFTGLSGESSGGGKMTSVLTAVWTAWSHSWPIFSFPFFDFLSFSIRFLSFSSSFFRLFSSSFALLILSFSSFCCSFCSSLLRSLNGVSWTGSMWGGVWLTGISIGLS